MRNLNSTLQVLLARFDGQIYIPFAAQISRKLFSQKKFQFAPQKRYSLHLSIINGSGEHIALKPNNFNLQEVE